MANPSPVQSKEFVASQFRAQGEIESNQPLSKKVIGIRLPLDIEAAIKTLPEEERVAWLRSVITKAVHKEILNAK